MAQPSKWVKPCSHGEPLQYRFVALMEKSLSSKESMEKLIRFLMCHISEIVFNIKTLQMWNFACGNPSDSTKDIYQG